MRFRHVVAGALVASAVFGASPAAHAQAPVPVVVGDDGGGTPCAPAVIGRSTDFGVTWGAHAVFPRTTIPCSPTGGQLLDVDTDGNGIVQAVGYRNTASGTRAVVLRSTDRGATFSTVYTGPAGTKLRSVTFIGEALVSNPDGWLYSGTSGASLLDLWSPDGTTISTAPQGLGIGTVDISVPFTSGRWAATTDPSEAATSHAGKGVLAYGNVAAPGPCAAVAWHTSNPSASGEWALGSFCGGSNYTEYLGATRTVRVGNTTNFVVVGYRETGTDQPLVGRLSAGDVGVGLSQITDTVLPGDGKLNSVAADGNTVIAIGESTSGPRSAIAVRSTDGGVTWTDISGSLPAGLESLKDIVYGGGKWIAVGGDSGVSITSSNGTSWSSPSNPLTASAGVLRGVTIS